MAVSGCLSRSVSMCHSAAAAPGLMLTPCFVGQVWGSFPVVSMQREQRYDRVDARPIRVDTSSVRVDTSSVRIDTSDRIDTG
jgi:hypothetical protein